MTYTYFSCIKCTTLILVCPFKSLPVVLLIYNRSFLKNIIIFVMFFDMRFNHHRIIVNARVTLDPSMYRFNETLIPVPGAVNGGVIRAMNQR